MSILITGASGFVGQNLQPYLVHKGIGCQALSLRSPGWQEAMPDHYDAIIHLAGKSHDVHHTSEPQAYFEVNTRLTQQLFDLFMQSNAKDFIYFSSVKAVADTVTGILEEDVFPQPGTAYGRSKREAESYLLNAQLPAGKRLFILRPCMIHGPGNKGNLNLLYQFVAKGIPYPLSAFDNKRSFLSIENLCYVVHALLEDTKIPSGVYNLADDEALSTNDLVRLIARSMNKQPRLLALPRVLVSCLARIGDRLSLPLNTERLNKLTESYSVSNEKIKAALGIKHLPVGAVVGLKATLAGFHKK